MPRQNSAVTRRRLVLGAAVLSALFGAHPPRAAEPSFSFVFCAGQKDATGLVMGGTEMRCLVTFAGKLFAGNGYWKDVPAPGGSPGAQILVLDAPGAPWRVDHEFNEPMPRGRARHLAISALAVARFRTDRNGAPLPAPVSLLLTSTWDLSGARSVFVRTERSADWVGTQLAWDRPSKNFLPQIRSFGTHRDKITGGDLVFAGDSRGIFAGTYDPAAPGFIRWSSTPELLVAETGADGFPGLTRRVRISSFAEAAGRLFAAIGQQVWVRDDGPAPHWLLLYTNPAPAYSQTGLRGLTAISNHAGGEDLLAAVEGQRSRIVRINPSNGQESTDLDLAGMLDRAWSTKVSYVIAAYNDMVRLPRPDGGEDLLIGLEAFIPPHAPRPPGHVVLDVVHGIEGGGWFLLRHQDGRYDLHQVTTQFPAIGQNLVSVRAAIASPFHTEPGAFYLGGYDANSTEAHDTAWIARADAIKDNRR